jgi:hypothetical protein
MKLMLSFAYAVPITLGASLIMGWWLMTLVGLVSQEWSPSIPTLSYLGAVKISLMFCIGPAIIQARARVNRWKDAEYFRRTSEPKPGRS